MHDLPTKKSAGIVFIGIYILGLFYLVFEKGTGVSDLQLLFRTVPGLLVCLLIGFLDDRYNFSSRRKLVFEIVFFIPYVHIFFPEFQLLGFAPNLPPILYSIVLAGYFIFVINLCNFMDGLDLYLTLTTIAGLFIFLSISNSILPINFIVILLLAICLSSFIFYNFPPARLFMGDTGSLPLGYMIALLPFMIEGKKVDIGYSFLIIPVFWVDGVWTIVRRFFKKENIFRAHREHLYQKISMNWVDKRITTLLFSAWNLLSIPLYFLLKDSFSLFSISILYLGFNSILYFLLIRKIG